MLTVDYVGRIDGTEFPVEPARTSRSRSAAAVSFLAFSRAARGACKPGETRTIEVTFPAEYGAPDAGRKGGDFDVTAHKSAVRSCRRSDDELAKKLGFDDLAAMRAAITQRFQSEYDQIARLRLKRQLLDALAESG